MRYNVLKSVAHNTGHSFVSLMNWRDGDYVMSHLTRAALATGAYELRADLIVGDAEPSTLLPDPVRASVKSYAKWLPNLLQSQNVEPSAVVGGSLRLRFALAHQVDDPHFRRHVTVPFECVVELTDDRGKVHVGRVRDTWTASRDFPPPVVTVFR